jgi:hypothetical protein
MILENIDFDSHNDFIHMERYVNSGSPSGFTAIYTTSFNTSAKSGKSFFYLSSIVLNGTTFQDYGLKPDFFKWDMLVHPDMVSITGLNSLKIEKRIIAVIPTASARTVKIRSKHGWFLKLNYRGLIGRIDRTIGRNQAQSSIEISTIISQAIEAGKLPEKFYFMREVFARVVDLEDEQGTFEFGLVIREPSIFPVNNKVKYLLPAFSLFSKDDKHPDDHSILFQLLKKQAKPPEDYLFENIIAPIFESYFKLLLTCGLGLECHAQNTMFAVDENFNVIGIVAKDAESIDKDISLIQDLQLDIIIRSDQWKCLRRADYNYQIMHSFMFDFKLGEYLIMPLIQEVAKNFTINQTRLINKIKALNSSYISLLPKDYFPLDGKWYNYDNIIHDRMKKRPYIANDNPKFR